MAKDKIIGAIISLVGLLIIIVYIFWGPLSLYFENHNSVPSGLEWLYDIGGFNWRYAVVIPLTLVVCLVGLLAVWIGYSMVTTPPPVPLEELEEELEAEEAASKAA